MSARTRRRYKRRMIYQGRATQRANARWRRSGYGLRWLQEMSRRHGRMFTFSISEWGIRSVGPDLVLSYPWPGTKQRVSIEISADTTGFEESIAQAADKFPESREAFGGPK